MSESFERIRIRYERLGAGPELECFLSLYRCLALEARLLEMPASQGEGAGARRPAARRRKAA